MDLGKRLREIEIPLEPPAELPEEPDRPTREPEEAPGEPAAPERERESEEEPVPA
jgi:hypothetical protein